MAIILVVFDRVATTYGQPLLREAPEADDTDAASESNPGERSPRRGRMTAEEEQQLRVQQLMEFQRDQMLKAAEEKAASERMMRYALWAAVAVIALTLLVAFARNRTDAPAGPEAGAGQGRGPAPNPPSGPKSGKENLNRD
ncbi:MAG TPA: hypothetical protein VJ783_17765 [Pirellulales bacterium]|nr:hypothetical protein [Pirellulales bacterium]